MPPEGEGLAAIVPADVTRHRIDEPVADPEDRRAAYPEGNPAVERPRMLQVPAQALLQPVGWVPAVRSGSPPVGMSEPVKRWSVRWR